MNERPNYYRDVETCVEETLRKVGRRITLGTPLGLGKANHLVNEFFRRAREYTIIGFLGNPKRQGNRDELGWKYIGFENPGMFSPPFGYYDAELLSGKKLR